MDHLLIQKLILQCCHLTSENERFRVELDEMRQLVCDERDAYIHEILRLSTQVAELLRRPSHRKHTRRLPKKRLVRQLGNGDADVDKDGADNCNSANQKESGSSGRSHTEMNKDKGVYDEGSDDNDDDEEEEYDDEGEEQYAALSESVLDDEVNVASLSGSVLALPVSAMATDKASARRFSRRRNIPGQASSGCTNMKAPQQAGSRQSLFGLIEELAVMRLREQNMQANQETILLSLAQLTEENAYLKSKATMDNDSAIVSPRFMQLPDHRYAKPPTAITSAEAGSSTTTTSTVPTTSTTATATVAPTATTTTAMRSAPSFSPVLLSSPIPVDSSETWSPDSANVLLNEVIDDAKRNQE